jgi:drug/metabolite transporter (DMT)-like permease
MIDKNKPKTYVGIAMAILAASLYALNAPLSKIVLDYLPSTLTAGFLYLGAGVGMFLVGSIKSVMVKESKEEKLSKEDFPYTLAMIVLDVLAPILLLLGLSMTTPENTSLLNNFEIVATAVIALCFFKEKIGKRLWLGIIFITVSCGILSFENILSLKFSVGSLFVVLASVCWGVENNCTRKLSSKDPLQIVVVKGICSGLTSIIIGLCIGQRITEIWAVFVTLGVGFVAYGLSIFFYVYAQRILGASRTSAYYAIAPFIGVLLSLVIFKVLPSYTFFIALALMAMGAWLCSKDEPILKKKTTTK